MSVASSSPAGLLGLGAALDARAMTNAQSDRVTLMVPLPLTEIAKVPARSLAVISMIFFGFRQPTLECWHLHRRQSYARNCSDFDDLCDTCRDGLD
jgi:hypothetical protein